MISNYFTNVNKYECYMLYIIPLELLMIILKFCAYASNECADCAPVNRYIISAIQASNYIILNIKSSRLIIFHHVLNWL